MKIESAKVVFVQDGKLVEVEFPNQMPLIEVAHKLIEIAQPQLEIKLTDERKGRFIQEANKAYIKSTSAGYSLSSFETYREVFVEKETEKYFAIERCNHAYNEMVLAYEEKIKQLTGK